VSAIPFSYPPADITVLPLDSVFDTLYPEPPGLKLTADLWPPQQAEYLRVYLKEIGCQTAVCEHHYIDRVYMHDDAVFYVRSFRSYPNFTKRVHFFTSRFGLAEWKEKILLAAHGQRAEVTAQLQAAYRGFSVIRPLPGCPVGRTVLPAVATGAPRGAQSEFRAVRRHNVHLAGLALTIQGAPFQQQDQGVSACATTALWSALDSVAVIEELSVASPANIAEAATRYPLQEGRPFPTEGLTIRQICEATRAAGLSPIVIKGQNPADYSLQISCYAVSGFAPVLALESTKEGVQNHAVCAVGARHETIKPQTDPSLKFREASTALSGVYIHDDRLGPYAFAELSPYTDPRSNVVRTRVAIEWPDKKPDDEWLLYAVVVPVPQKLRLTITRMRRLGLIVAQAIGDRFDDPLTTLDCRYELASRYGERAYGFGLSDNGIYQLECQTSMSRFVGLIEITSPSASILDVVLDTTETQSEPAVLACVCRAGFPADEKEFFQIIARYLGASPIS
jgi:hypothetical protein